MAAWCARYCRQTAMRPRAAQPPEEPKDAQGFNQRGNRYSRNGVYDQAIRDYTRAIELDADYAEALFNRGVSYYEIQRYEEAIADFSRAIALNPRNDSAYSRRSLAYLLTDQLDLAQADQDKCEELRGSSPK
ncbi:MAG: tetratricopeptide repeat protein [SAR202 cluster bacterium]|nr:tetratricopeptide repeat protein [SAR202 cluster bacterium]